MQRLLTKTKQFIFERQTSLFSSTLIISGMMLLARFFGFLRYSVLVNFFTPEELDIYFAAFRIPDIVFEILITGALATTFIPFFIKYQKNKEEQSIYISSIMNMIMLLLVGGIALLFITIPFFVEQIVQGFSEEKMDKIILYSRILLIGQLPFFVAAGLLTGISQARKSFIIPALAPMLYNIAIIGVTILLNSYFHLLAPILGVIVGAVFMFLVQLPILYLSGFQYRFVLQWSKELWLFFKTAIPRIITTVIYQIDATVDLAFATFLGAGSYTIFYLAQHLQLLPISLMGVAIGQASLPYLTEIYQTRNMEAFKKIITDTLLSVFFITLPLMCFFIVSRTPIVRLFFGRDKFDWDATVLTARTLSFFALSIPFHSLYYFTTRCFYALFDTMTPFIVGTCSILLNIALTALFIHVLHLSVWAMALSFSIAMTINVLILLFLLWRRVGGFHARHILLEVGKMSISIGISALVLFFLNNLTDQLVFETDRTIMVFLFLAVNGGIFFSLYLFLSWLFKVREVYLLTKVFLKIRQYQRKFSEMYAGGID